MLERLLRESAGAIAAAGADIVARRPRFAVIAARGSSDNVARYAQHLFGRFWGMPVALATPSLHTLYDAALDYRDALVIGISQSGASPDVAGVVKAATAAGRGHGRDHQRAGLAAGGVGPARDRAAHRAGALGGGDQDLHGVAGRGRRAGRRRRRASWRRCRTRWRASSTRRVPAEAAAGVAAAGRRRPRRRLRHRVRGGAEALRADRRDRRPVLVADFMHGPIAIVEPGFPILAIAPSGPTLDGLRELLDAATARGADVTVISDAPICPAAGSTCRRCRSGSRRSSPSSPPRSSPSAPPRSSAATSTARPASRRSRSRHERGRDARHQPSRRSPRPTRTARAPSTRSASRYATASSWCSSARPAAASRRC